MRSRGDRSVRLRLLGAAWVSMSSLLVTAARGQAPDPSAQAVRDDLARLRQEFENEFLFQFQFSIGAHGAHVF